MENAARNFIVAVQNSLLGDLAWKIISIGMPMLIFGTTLYPGDEGRMASYLVIIGALAGLPLIFGIWLIGHIANLRPTRSPAEASARPRNGFDAWNEMPEGGLRPSSFMRGLVTKLGANSPRAKLFAGVSFGAFAICLLSAIWSYRLHPLFPTLSVEQIRMTAVGGCLLSSVPMILRSWATASFVKLSERATARPGQAA